MSQVRVQWSVLEPIFQEIYNNPEISSLNIHKEISARATTIAGSPVNFTKDYIQSVYETKLNLFYKNRPRKQKVDLIDFSNEGEPEPYIVPTPVKYEDTIQQTDNF